MAALAPAEFAALMAPLGPFEPAPHLALTVSGGADSTALALLARDWCRARGGRVTALVADHGLRPASAAEADLTIARLAGLGITARLLRLEGLRRGPGLAARARQARHAALEAECAALGVLHLLLGHHAADQAETIAIRQLDHSGPAGLAGMAALVETGNVRRLRPLLAVPPGRLRDTLRQAGMEWVEDPSNADPAALRARLRRLRGDPAGEGPATRAACVAAMWRGRARTAAEQAIAVALAEHASIHPEGYAVLAPGRVSPGALAALLRLVAGAPRAPRLSAVAALADRPAAATLAGARVLTAGRLAAGHFLLVREAAAMQAPVPARPGARWDGRFRLARADFLPKAAMLGALGDDAARLRHHSPLPSAILRTLPALRAGGRLVAVPHLRYLDAGACPAGDGSVELVFDPPDPAACAPFLAATVGA
jgi:tRNA(Ile)-lysidine synthase